jgi:ABC-2 type transport system ATP-binding protein
VILSTHVLAEVEATCTRLLIIHQGRLAADGTAADLLSAKRSGPSYLVEARGEDIEGHLGILPHVATLEAEPLDGRVRVRLTTSGDEDLRPLIFRMATERGWTLWELHRERESLEHLFRDLTTGSDDGVPTLVSAESGGEA